jgi:hypothetical protein
MSVEALRAGKSSDLKNYHQKSRYHQLFLQKAPATDRARLMLGQLGRKIFSAGTFLPEEALSPSLLSDAVSAATDVQEILERPAHSPRRQKAKSHR